MQIDYSILITYGCIAKKLDKGEFIFKEGTTAFFCYQVIEGEVKLFSTNKIGKDLIQGVFRKGQSFGEPPLLLNKSYPNTAQATMPSVVVKIDKEKFTTIIKDFPEILNNIFYTFAERIYNNAVLAQVWVSHTPEDKIAQFLIRIKEMKEFNPAKPIPYTRQQIADFTGLRVETVIRTLRQMHNKGIVNIINHKLYYK
ncbi:MAG: Crp/Fnr family transcriptional regulator [Chitinophagaceae bacterium]|nr:Crp/Fnr family transcriptional regulator [Chitinophagaceae bacterium]MCW5905403.1 Crp/Fnr family transcriptional regulator [Chitinophagaceae bacterium]